MPSPASPANAQPANGQASQTTAIEIVLFSGAHNWPLYVAQDKGFFADNGLTVNFTPTPDSVFQMVGLIDGKFHVAMTAIDNVTAYVEGQGAAQTKNTADIVAFVGCDDGFLHLTAVPEVTDIAQLKGSKLAVDALTTGYAFVLRKILERSGLKEQDYQLVQAGGVKNRFDGLMKKDFSGTLLVSPLEVGAEQNGFNILASASSIFKNYQGDVLAARRDWLESHDKEVIGFIRAYRAALDWLADSANRSEAIAVLKKHEPGTTDATASAASTVLLDPQSSFFTGGSINLDGVRTVLDLRSQYGVPKKELRDPGKYCAVEYLDKAKSS